MKDKDKAQQDSAAGQAPSHELAELRKRIVQLEAAEIERKQIEEALQECEDRHRSLFDRVPVGLYRTTPDGQILDANPALVKMLGYPDRESLLATTAAACYVDADDRRLWQTLMEKEGVVRGFETEWRCSDGTTIWIRDSAKAVWDDEGRVLYYEGSVEDVTERRQAEQAVRESERLLRQVVDTSPSCVFVKDKEGKYTLVNRQFAQLYGTTPDWMEGKTIWELYPLFGLTAEQAHEFTTNDWAVIDSQQPKFFPEEPFVMPDGTTRWFQTTKAPLCVGDVPEHVLGVSVDITERKQAEDIVRNIAQGVSAATGDEFFRSLVQYLAEILEADYVFIGDLAEGDERVHTIAVCAHGEIAENFEYDLKHTPCEEVAARGLCYYPYSVQQQYPADRLLAELGIESYVGTSLFDSAGQPLGIMVVLDDEPLTHVERAESLLRIFAIRASAELERRRAEQALQESERKFRSIAEQSQDGVLLTDEQGLIIEWNGAQERITGLGCAEVLGRPLWEVQFQFALEEEKTAERREGLERSIRQLLSGEQPTWLDRPMENRIVRPDGSHHTIQSVAFPIETNKGLMVGGITRDVTETRQAAEALRQSEATLRSIFRAAPIGIGLVSDRVFVWTNDTLCQMVGYSAEELVGQSARIVYETDQEFERVGREKYADIAVGGTGSIETRFRHKDGAIIDVLLSSTPLDPDAISSGVVFTALDITERKRAEKALRESEGRFRLLFEQAPIGMAISDLDGRYLQINQAHCNTLGYTEEELLRRSFMDITPAEDLPANLALREQALHGERSSFQLEKRFITKGGETVYTLLQVSLVRDAGGQPVHFIGQIADITDQKRSEEALKESEAKFRNIVESSPMGMHMYQLEPDGRLVFMDANPAADQILGVDNQQFVGKTVEEAFPALAESEVPERYRTVASTGRTWQADQINYEENQISGAFEVHAFQTSPGRMTAAFLDITERKRAEEALARRAAQLALINEIGSRITTMQNLDLVMETASRLVHEKFGYHHVAVFTLDREQDELTMRARSGSYVTLFPSDYRLKSGAGMVGWSARHGETLLANDVHAEPRYINAYPDRIPTRSELSVPIRIGQELVGVLDAQSPELNAFDENDVMVMETLADQIAVAIEDTRLYQAIEQELAERKRAEERVRRQNEFLRNIMESLTHPFYVVNLNDYSIEVANSAAGLDSSLEGATCYAHVHHRDGPCSGREYPCPLEEVKRTRGPVSVEHIHYDKDGTRRNVEIHTYPILNGDGNVVQAIEYILDITERRQAEQMLLQSERLAAMGRLAASVAHEINNPLQSVQGCLTLAGEELADRQRREKLERYLSIAEGEIERIADIVRRMRDFYRPRAKGMERTDVHASLESVLELAGKQLQHSNVTVERAWASDLPNIQANPDHLKQVFLNLILNAIDAMPDGGTLHVRTLEHHMPVRGDQPPQPAVYIEFSDTGLGMSPETRARLFEPFFTTKEQGSGLGLYISHGIVGSHGGQIGVISHEGLGSTFSILLPVEQP